MGLLDTIGKTIAKGIGNFDQQVFNASLLLRLAGGKVKEFLDPIGPERLGWMIENNVSLDTCIPPEQLQKLRDGAKNYADIAAKLTDQQVVMLLPQWALDVVADHEHQGNVWLRGQLKTIRSYFGG
ncbi:MAG: hypothetical protein WC331_10025 [Candidatus Omnitrophota bacterium]|jgi:hypothetical protein